MEEPQICDIIGCGFGPSNLAIAVAILERWSDDSSKGIELMRKVTFIEKHPNMLWHPGMLLPGARMQISCLKDLVTLRRPTSPFTFLSYLHSQGRLVAFINRGTLIPTRREFADYLAWAAAEVQKQGISVAYSEEVVSISEVSSTLSLCKSVSVIEVVSRRIADNCIVKRCAKNIILGAGGSPYIPKPLSSLIRPSERPAVIHSSDYANSVGSLLEKLGTKSPLRIAVIGAGQSSVEILLDLHRRLESRSPNTPQNHELDIIIREGSLKPSDDSPFVNEIFDPTSTDVIYYLPMEHSRKAILDEYKNTNYGVVNKKTLDTLYGILYEQTLEKDIATRVHEPMVRLPRISIRANQCIVSANVIKLAHERDSIELELSNTLNHTISPQAYDAVFCGTGYDRSFWMRILANSNLASRYGLPNSADDVRPLFDLVPEHQTSAETVHSPTLHSSELFSQSASATNSSTGTPLSSHNSFELLPIKIPVRISRNYLLLPVGSTSDSKSSPRVYLQGYSESTHGLSDTLLSVIGIRAGEVVEDLWQNTGNEQYDASN